MAIFTLATSDGRDDHLVALGGPLGRLRLRRRSGSLRPAGNPVNGVLAPGTYGAAPRLASRVLGSAWVFGRTDGGLFGRVVDLVILGWAPWGNHHRRGGEAPSRGPRGSASPGPLGSWSGGPRSCVGDRTRRSCMDPPLKAVSDRCPFRLVGARSRDSTNTCGGTLDSSAHQGYSVCDGHAAGGEEAFLAGPSL